MDPIRLNVPLLGQEELDEVKKVLDSGFLTQGPKVVEFEDIIRDFIGAQHVFAMSSATTALHLSAVALGIGIGDEVLVADFTFPATANIVVQQGALPIPVDIDLETFTVDVADLESKITPRTKAIIPVDAFGLSCDIGAINKVAHAHDLPVIQDSACSLGSEYEGKKVGSLATTTCFSFHPRKSITTGEGGMLATDDDRIAEQVSILRTHGGVKKEFYLTFEEAGFNYRMSDVLAAIGIAQTQRLEYLLTERSRLAQELTSRLSTLEGVTPPITPTGRTHTFQSYVVLLPRDLDRDNVIRRMREKNVETTLGTYALHAQPFFTKTYSMSNGDCPRSFEAFQHSLTLPLWAGMTDSQLDYIVESLDKTINDERA